MPSTECDRVGNVTLPETGMSPVSRRAAFGAWLLLLSALAQPAWTEPPAPAADHQQLWLINTRCVSTCGWQCVSENDFDYQRYDCATGWTSVDAATFFDATSADVPTTFYIHGNRVTPYDAIHEGQYLYQLLCEAAGERPFRLVIWSWPATQIPGGVRHDVLTKAARSDVQAYYLAQVVDRMPKDARVGMMGHSFGARTITGALHLLGGGELCGYALPPRADRPARAVRSVLVAAALDNGWLLPGWRNGLALSQTEKMMITRNGYDRQLRWYPRMYGRRGPDALGFTGPACPSWLGEDRAKLDVVDVSCSVGRGHGWFEYLCSWSVRCRLAWYAFLESPAASETPDVQEQPSKPESSSWREPTAAAQPIAEAQAI